MLKHVKMGCNILGDRNHCRSFGLRGHRWHSRRYRENPLLDIPGGLRRAVYRGVGRRQENRLSQAKRTLSDWRKVKANQSAPVPILCALPFGPWSGDLVTGSRSI